MKEFAWICSVIAVFTMSCSSSSTKISTTTSVAPVKKVFRIGEVAEPEFLDPAKMSDASSSHIAVNLYEGLTDYDHKTFKPVPGVATHWDISKNGKVYTFYLRQNAKWSDGKSVTAQDFVYSWQRVLNPETASKYAFIMYYMKNAYAINKGTIKDLNQLGVTALDDYTLRVELENPTPFFVSLVGWYTYRPVRKDIVEKYNERWPRPEHFVGNGYFTLSEWIPQKHVSIVPNEHYWDRKNVHLDKVVFHPLEERETALKKYLKGELEYVYDLPAMKVIDLKKRPDYHEPMQLGTYMLIINTTQAPMDNQKLRKALSYAIDRKQLVKLINRGKASASYIPSGLGEYNSARGCEFNPVKAKELLKEAGYTSGADMPEVTLLYNTNENHKTVMQILQNMWKTHLGIHVQIHNMEWKIVLKSQVNLNYQISRLGWIGDYFDPNTFLEIFLSESSSNLVGWKNKEYDALLAKAMQTTDDTKRYELYHQAETMLLDHSPMIPIYTYTVPMLISPKLTHFYTNMMNMHPLKYVDMTE